MTKREQSLLYLRTLIEQVPEDAIAWLLDRYPVRDILAEEDDQHAMRLNGIDGIDDLIDYFQEEIIQVGDDAA